MTHTKGPWLFKISTPKEESEKWGGNCGANAHVYCKTGKFIFGVESTKTIVHMPHWRNESENDEYIANCKLIAAAPDLLQALKALLTDADDRGEIRDDDGELFQDWKNAIVAIEKATGESLGYLEEQTAN